MPIVNNQYVNPGFVDGQSPDCDAANLNDIGNTLAAATNLPTANTLVWRDVNGRQQNVDPVNPQDTASKNYVDTSIAASINVGDTVTTERTNLGANFLLCNGATINPTTYPALSALLQVTPNGLWTKKALPVTTCLAMKVINGYFVAYGGSASFYYCPVSNPTAGWTTVTLAASIVAIAWGNGYWVAVTGANATTALYYNANSNAPTGGWTQNASVGYSWLSSSYFGGLVYGNGYWAFCVTSSTNIPVTICSRANDPTGAFTQATFGGNYVFNSSSFLFDPTTNTFIWCGWITGSNPYTIYTATTSPTTWTFALTVSGTTPVVNIQYVNSVWYATISSVIYTGATLAALTSSGITLSGGGLITYLNGMWVQYGTANVIYTCASSTPFGPWVLTTNNLPATNITSLLYASGYFAIYESSTNNFYYISKALPLITTNGYYTYMRAL